jgi:hypothetical protein
MKLYQELAVLVGAYHRCRVSTDPAVAAFASKHVERLSELEKLLPSGGGFDLGSHLDIDNSTDERLVIRTSFHHMNDAGFYDGWTDHQIVVRPSLVFGMALRIAGRNRNDIKEYMYEVFHETLTTDVPVELDEPINTE